VDRLAIAGRRYAERTGGGEATVFVILDGENAWEYYDGQGRPFLRALYERLAAHRELKTVTMSEACAEPAATLPSIFPGSWISGDFYIWIGHGDDHRAWSQLAEARRTLDLAAGAAPPEALARAREEILIAEGSDWFWWYGDDHSSDHDLAFDELFRRHVRNVYRALDRPIPEELFVSNITTVPPAVPIDPPTGFIHPVVDGEATSYFEWVGAGCVDAAGAAGAMHQAGGGTPLISAIEFGFDLEHLYVRVDGTAPMRRLFASGIEVRIKFLQPAGLQATVRFAGTSVAVQLEERVAAGSWQRRACPGAAAAVGDLLEVRLPFACLGAEPHARLAFLVAVNRGGAEVEHHPRHAPIELECPDAQFPARNWTA
jgi:hypothetical protein